MNQRYPQDPSRRYPGRPDLDYARNMQGRGERFARYPGDREDYEGARGDAAWRDVDYDEPSYGQGQDQTLGSYPTERGPRYYEAGRAAYGNEDFRQRAGQRAFNAAPYARQGQRQFVGQGPRAASSADQGYGYGNFRQSRYQPGYGASAGGYARDYDEGDFDQAFGSYSPPQYAYGDSGAAYGRGGYGSTYGQDFDDDFLGSTNAPVQTGAYGQGPGGYGGGFHQGLAGRSGYGMGSGYTRGNEGLRESQFGKGPKGYVRSDERLKEDISEKLMRNHLVDASDISVEARNGAVTLSGSVDDRQLKHYVEDLVERCAGVRDIDNRLTVRPRTASRPQSGSGSLGGSTGDATAYPGQSAASGTTGSKVSTGNADDGGSTRSRN
jgi:hypothetical protein